MQNVQYTVGSWGPRTGGHGVARVDSDHAECSRQTFNLSLRKMLKKICHSALKTKAIDLLAKAIDLEAKVIKIWPRDTSWSGLVLRTTAALKAKTKAIDLEAKAIDLKAKAIKIWPRGTSRPGLVLRTTLMAEAGTDEPAYARGWCFSIGS